jgi:hypothetical protein
VRLFPLFRFGLVRLLRLFRFGLMRFGLLRFRRLMRVLRCIGLAGLVRVAWLVI